MTHFFTFGPSHSDANHASLNRHYTSIRAESIDKAVAIMNEKRGSDGWAGCFGSYDEIKDRKLTPLQFDRLTA